MAILADCANYVNYGDGSTTGYYAVAQWAASTTYAAGNRVRQLTAPAVGSERIFICVAVTGDAKSAATETALTTTRGAKTTDNHVTWQECTGLAGLNGDLANTPTWAQLKASSTPTLGCLIQRNSGGSLQICTTAGTMASSEPAFSNTAGVTTADGTSVWTSLGAPSNYAAFSTPHARLNSALVSNWRPLSSAPAYLESGTDSGCGTTFVADNHAETLGTASSTITATLTLGGLYKILCVDKTKAAPYASGDLKTTASCTTTGNNTMTISGTSGSIYFYGITFSSGSGANIAGMTITASNAMHIYDNCVLKKAGTTASNSAIACTSSDARIVCENTSVYFGATGDSIDVPTGEWIFRNVTGGVLAASSAVPSHFMGPSANSRTVHVLMEGCDLSQLTGTLNNIQSVTTAMQEFVVSGCKLNSALTLSALSIPKAEFQFIDADSSTTNYVSSRTNLEGAETTETSCIRTGGAVDGGGQGQARKIIPTVDAMWAKPYSGEPFAIYNDKTGANVNVNVYGLSTTGALPINDEVWLDIEYMGTASSIVSKIITTGKANFLGTTALATTDSSTWGNQVVTLAGGQLTGACTLSNGNLTVTHNNTSNNTGAQAPFAIDVRNCTKKLFFEITLTTSTSNGCDIGLGGDIVATLTGGAGGTPFAMGVVLGVTNSFLFAGTTTLATNLGAAAANDVFGFAFDFANQKFWIRKNAGNWNADASADPATNTNGTAFFTPVFGYLAPCGRFTNAGATDAFTFNFGATAFAHAAPSGFSAFNTLFMPFVITAQLDTTHNPQPQYPGLITVRPRFAVYQGGRNAAGSAPAQMPTYYIDPKITLT